MEKSHRPDEGVRCEERGTLSFLLYIPYVQVSSYVLKRMVRIIGRSE